MVAILAVHPQEAILQATACKEIFKLPLDIARQGLPLCFELGAKRWVVGIHELIEQRLLWLSTLVGRRQSRCGHPGQRHDPILNTVYSYSMQIDQVFGKCPKVKKVEQLFIEEGRRPWSDPSF
jgi:hypothetical protein